MSDTLLNETIGTSRTRTSLRSSNAVDGVYNFTCDKIMDITGGRIVGDFIGHQCRAKVVDTIAGQEKVRIVISGFTEADFDDWRSGDLTIEMKKTAFKQACFNDDIVYTVKALEEVEAL